MRKNKIQQHRPHRPLEEPQPNIMKEMLYEPTSTTFYDDRSLFALRAALRAELCDLLGGDLIRNVIRDELTLTAREVVVPEVREALESTAPHPYGGLATLQVAQDADEEEPAPHEDLAPENHFTKIAESWNAVHDSPHVPAPEGAHDRFRSVHYWYHWWMRLREPHRDGVLMRVATSHALETWVSLIILLDVVLMIYRGDRAISQPGSTCDFCVIIDWVFQIMYTTELLLRVAAHRQWFFCNSDWKQNWFDVFLVISGFAGLLGKVGTGGSFRVLRLLRLGKALRALKVMTRIKHLRTFVVCMQGSLSPFFWALVMLCAVFMIFSLFFVQMVGGYIEDEGVSLSGELEDMFGSVGKSMLTLYMASSGGDDWSRAYDVIGKTGWIGSVIFLFFIAFVQLSMINIITGIFVDAAMQTLAPDVEMVAMQRIAQEKEAADDLERLCRLVDADESGKLTPEQFQNGMKVGRIPMLLTMLGLRHEHVSMLFKEMSNLSKDGSGEVDIDKFVLGCMELKGPGTHFDMQMILAQLGEMKIAHARELRDIKGQLRHLECPRSGSRTPPISAA